MMNEQIKRIIKCEAGFSLVELAIVLLVMGLLIGGVMKGQELVESARLKSVLSQVNEYRTAVAIFMEKYQALPGDFHQAKARIQDDLRNGDGNGVISGDGLDAHAETVAFWQHLAAADLIASPGMAVDKEADFGAGVPTSRLGGGFTITYGAFGRDRHWLVLGAKNGNKNNNALLTPAQAMSLDQRIGKVNQGVIRVTDGANTPGKCLVGQEYNMKTKEPACVVYFMM